MFRVDPEFDSLREALATAIKRLGIGGHYGDDPYGLADELVPYFVPVERCEPNWQRISEIVEEAGAHGIDATMERIKAEWIGGSE